MLPPVAYAPAGAAAGNGRQTGTLAGRDWPPAGGPGRAAAGSPVVQRRHPLLVLATMLIAVSVSVMLPVAGTLLALAAIVALRAGELAGRGVAQRRTERGARAATDHLVAAAAFPWFLLRSVIAALLLAPFALTVAAVVGVITMLGMPGVSLPRAVAYAAGALVAFYGLGPGSGKARRQLNRIFGTIIGTRSTEAVALIALSALAVGAVAAAASSASAYWPLVAPAGLFPHLPGWHGITQLVHFRFWRPRFWRLRLW